MTTTLRRWLAGLRVLWVKVEQAFITWILGRMKGSGTKWVYP